MKADIDALRASIGTASNLNNTLLERALRAATSWARDRVMPEVFNDDETQEAIVLLASRWYKRRQSPEGVAGWSDLGLIRIISQDPDIERMLERKIDYSYGKAGLA